MSYRRISALICLIIMVGVCSSCTVMRHAFPHFKDPKQQQCYLACVATFKGPASIGQKRCQQRLEQAENYSKSACFGGH